jgi:hypothetical protein
MRMCISYCSTLDAASGHIHVYFLHMCLVANRTYRLYGCTEFWCAGNTRIHKVPFVLRWIEIFMYIYANVSMRDTWAVFEFISWAIYKQTRGGCTVYRLLIWHIIIVRIILYRKHMHSGLQEFHSFHVHANHLLANQTHATLYYLICYALPGRYTVYALPTELYTR